MVCYITRPFCYDKLLNLFAVTNKRANSVCQASRPFSFDMSVDSVGGLFSTGLVQYDKSVDIFGMKLKFVSLFLHHNIIIIINYYYKVAIVS